MLKKSITFLIALIMLAVVGCQGKNATATQSAPNDLLTKILARGTIIVATDAAYPPQSELKADAKRAANTKCAPNEATADEFTGFDVATAIEIAKRLGVEACFVSPQWGQLVAGNWDGRWDISVGSMAPTPERLEALYFSQPYYATPAAFFVHKDNVAFSTPKDLAGKRIGACTGCTYDDYLRGVLNIPGDPIDFVVKDPQIIGYDVDLSALKDLAEGDGVNLDATLTAQPTGLQSIQDGMPIKQLGEPVFFEYLSTATDKKSNYASYPLTLKVTEIIQQMHADGTLLELSKQYYGTDYATIAGEFNIEAVKQQP
jgi:polar amino acid transport system substrate-binding protein